MLRFSAFLSIVSAALVLGLLIHFGNVREEARYVGVDVCGACHATTSSGLVYQDWQRGPHQQAYDLLQSDSAQRYLRERNLEPDGCMACHTTLGRAGLNEFEEQLNSAGVGCERCHGPGSEYVQTTVMKNRDLMMASGGSPGSLADCYSCHAESPAEAEHVCPFQNEPFDAERAWERIGHSRTPVDTTASDTTTSDNGKISP